MVKLIKEVLLLAVFLLLFMPFSHGLSVTCNPTSPITIAPGGSFSATVSHSGASEVGFGTSPSTTEWIPDSSSHTFNVQPSASDTYYGVAKDSEGTIISDSNQKCSVTLSCSANSNPSVSITTDPDSLPSGGGSVSITVSANDAEGITLIKLSYSDGSNTITRTKSCSGTSCSEKWTETISQSTTFSAFAYDTCSVEASDTTTVTVTSTNSPPYFTTTSPLPDATKGVSYSTTIQASDDDGDSIVYSFRGDVPAGMSIDSSTGVLSWSSPDITKTVSVQIYDKDSQGNQINPAVEQSFTLPVSQCTDDVLCPSQLGVCSGSKQTCVNGQLSPSSCSLVYAAIADYESPEVSCDGLDNDCDGTTDEGCGCIDNDGDSFNQSAPNCGPADCDDDKTNDPSGCPTTKTGCKELTSRCAICTYPDAKEYCDFIDNNCNGNVDEGGVCTCDKLLGLGKTGKAKILFPAEGANFFAGGLISFIAEKNAIITAYMWEFGNGQTDVNDKGASAISYLNTGDYMAKLKTIDDKRCEDIASITLHINPCQKKEDCSEGKTCQNGICKEAVTTAENVTEPLTITINSPKNQLYSNRTVPLIYTTSRPSQCSYSLNSQDHISIQKTTNSVTGKEGANTLRLRCGNTTASVQFTVKLQTRPTTVFDDLKGGSRESLFETAKERGEELTLTPVQAEEVISEVMQAKGLEITKSREISGSKSLIMLNIRNLLPITLENTRIKVTVPKTAAETAGEIQSPQEFTVIENDPIIEFLLSLIKKEQESIIMFEVNAVVDEELLKQITAETEEDLTSLIKKQQETGKAAKITKEFEEYEKDGETYTRIKTKITPKKGLKGMALIEKLPKCLAQQIDYIKMDEKYRSQIKILNPDPLIMWHFEEVTSEKYFEYEVKGVLSEECKKQIRAMGIAEELGLDIESRSYFRIILPLLIIPLIGVLIVHFHRFSDIMKKKEEGEKKTAKKLEKPQRPEKPRMEMKEEKDVGEFLDKEIKEAEKEFKKGLK